MATVQHNDYAREMAIFALEAVEGYSNKKKLDSLVSKMPTLIRYNGLAPTMAFLFSKGKGEHEYLLEKAKEWAKKKSAFRDFFSGASSGKVGFYKALCRLPSTDYRTVTNEMIQLFNWMRRFSSTLKGS